MQHFKYITLIAGLAATVAITGCSTWGTHDDSGRSAGRVVDDNKIAAQVKSELATEPVYKFNDVDVRTFNGVVQLSGFVGTQEQKQRAGQLASSTPGVARVINNISLRPESPMPTGRTTGSAYPENLNKTTDTEVKTETYSPTNHVNNP